MKNAFYTYYLNFDQINNKLKAHFRVIIRTLMCLLFINMTALFE